MKHVRALSMDKHFKEMTNDSKIVLIVHSVFERTINILIEDELFTLACSQIDNAPATLVIDLPDFNGCDIDANMRGFLSPEKVEINGSLSINLTSTPTWECQLIDFPTDKKDLVKNISIAKREIGRKGHARWLLEKESKLTAFDKEMGRMLRERTTLLIEKFLTSSTNQNIQHAKQLIGLGQGLTPSGDDFLVGLLLAFSMNKNENFRQKEWSELIVKEAKSNTNIISYSALRYAAIGQARETVGLFIEALVSEKKEESIKQTLSKVMEIGSSSGTEMAWGILNGLTLLLKQEEQNDNTSKN